MRRRITTITGTDRTTIVSGRAANPQASVAETASRYAWRPRSSQRSVAHAAISHIAALVVSERYDADHSNVAHAVVHSHHVMNAVHSLASRLARENTSAPQSPVSSAGISPGQPSQMPGASVRACAGGYFANTAGSMKTCICSKNAASGGAGAVQRQRAKISACKRYARSSWTVPGS